MKQVVSTLRKQAVYSQAKQFVYSGGVPKPTPQKPNWIREFRERRGWSLETLASRIVPPTTPQHLGMLERGTRRLTVDWLRRIATALDVEPQELLDGGASQLSPREKALVEVFRGLSEEQQKAFWRALVVWRNRPMTTTTTTMAKITRPRVRRGPR